MSENLIQTIRKESREIAPLPTGVEPRLEPLGGIRVVVFDIYGTLFCSGSGDIGLAQAEDREDTMRAVLGEFGVSLKEGGRRIVDRFHRAIQEAQKQRRDEGVEYPEVEIREVWASMLKSLRDEGLIDNAPAEEDLPALALTYESRVNPVWPMPGVGDLLDSLAAAGLRMGIVSNAQFFTPLLFDALLGRSLTDLGFDPEARVYSYALREAKPSVKLYQLVASRLKPHGIEPHQALYVGNDMRNDIWPAALAGFKTCLFAGDKRSLRMRQDDQQVKGTVPDLVVTELGEVGDAVRPKSEI